MVFALYFTIGLAVVLILGAVIIWKSDLPSNQKLTSLLIIMALFAAVSIVNEAKRVKPLPGAIKTSNFDKIFYTPPTIDSLRDYRLPRVDEAKNVIHGALKNWDALNPKSTIFTFLHTEKEHGTTLILKEYTTLIQTNNTPIVHVQLKYPSSGLFEFTRAMRVPNVEAIDDTVRKFNHEGAVPTLFIEDAQNALITDGVLGNGFVSPICKYLVELYDTHKVNIILVSNDAQTKNLLRSGKHYTRGE